MNAVSLQRSAVLSFVVHITLFGMILLAVRQSNHFVLPSPYVVNLVGPEVVSRVKETRGEAVRSAPEEKRTVKDENREAPKALSRSEEQRLSDAIEAMKAKKKIEQHVNLRDLISLKGGRGEKKAASAAGAVARGTGSITENYASRVGEEIRQHWVFPDMGDKSMEAIVSIRIQKNGSVQIIGIEKSSGSPLFDRSALRAITKASPVTAPPYEMEVGVRFYP